MYIFNKIQLQALVVDLVKTILNIKEKQHLQDSFSDFYDQYAPKIYGLILKAGYSSKASEELLNTIFLDSWREYENTISNKKHPLLALLRIMCKRLGTKNILRQSTLV